MHRIIETPAGGNTTPTTGVYLIRVRRDVSDEVFVDAWRLGWDACITAIEGVHTNDTL